MSDGVVTPIEAVAYTLLYGGCLLLLLSFVVARLADPDDGFASGMGCGGLLAGIVGMALYFFLHLRWVP